MATLDPAHVFERYVETDPGICNACYERVPREETGGTNVEAKGRTGLVATRDDDGRVDGVAHADDHSARYHWEGWDVCPRCGELGLASPDDPLPIGRAVERTVPLSRRLAEREIPHKWRHLAWFVHRAKRREAIASKDRDITARAVEWAVGAAMGDSR